MRRREEHAIRRHSINLYDGDYEALQIIHGTRIGAAKIIRDLVRAHLRAIQRKAEHKGPTHIHKQ